MALRLEVAMSGGKGGASTVVLVVSGCWIYCFTRFVSLLCCYFMLSVISTPVTHCQMTNEL